MADIPRVNISTDADIFWIRMERRTTNPDNANATDRFNFGIVNDVLTWIDSSGNVFTAASGSSLTPPITFSGATASNPILSLKSTDNSATNPVLRFLNSSDAAQTLLYYDGSAVFNEAGNSVNFRIEGDTDANTFFLRGASDEIILGSQTTLTSKLAVYVATASKAGLSLKSTDDSATIPILRSYDSGGTVRWQIDYEGTARLGRTSGGTHNGNMQFFIHDQFPAFNFRSATTDKGKLIADVNAGSFIIETAQLDVRASGGNPIARFATSNAQLGVGTNATSLDTTLWANLENATTNATDNVLTVSHNSTGTPAASFGGAMVMKLESSTTTFTLAARMRWQWTVATHASRTARGILSAYDTAERDCFMWEASGAAPMLGFFGTNPVVKPTVTGSRGGNAALASLLTALAGEGLLTDSTTA